MEITDKKRVHTYVVIEDINTRWGFVGFDPDTEVQYIGTRKNCADWIIRNSGDTDSFCVITLDEYEERYCDTPEINHEEDK